MPYINPILKQLSNYKSIAWDFDETLVNSLASETIQEFILDHPDISHNILTARSGEYLINSIFPELSRYPAFLTRANFKRVLSDDDEKYEEYQRARHARKIGKLAGPLTPIEIYEFTIKGKRCKELGIPVLVDDNVARSKMGCVKYGIRLIDPLDLL